jgi:hypothetical protein
MLKKAQNIRCLEKRAKQQLSKNSNSLHDIQLGRTEKELVLGLVVFFVYETFHIHLQRNTGGLIRVLHHLHKNACVANLVHDSDRVGVKYAKMGEDVLQGSL